MSEISGTPGDWRIVVDGVSYTRADSIPERPEPGRLEIAVQIYCALIVKGFQTPEEAHARVRTSLQVADAIIAEHERSKSK